MDPLYNLPLMLTQSIIVLTQNLCMKGNNKPPESSTTHVDDPKDTTSVTSMANSKDHPIIDLGKYFEDIMYQDDSYNNNFNHDTP